MNKGQKATAATERTTRTKGSFRLRVWQMSEMAWETSHYPCKAKKFLVVIKRHAFITVIKGVMVLKMKF